MTSEIFNDHLKHMQSISVETLTAKAKEYAADVRSVVHGKWVHPVPGDGEPYCSACKAEAEYFYGYGYFEPDFCPNCGADMSGGGEHAQIIH